MSNLFVDWDDLDRLWIGGVIPFEIDPSVDLAETDGVLRPYDAVLAAIDHWEAHTPVRFVPRELEDVHWVTFLLDDRATNCNSGLGRNRDLTETGHRVEFPSTGCSEPDLIHEIGHRIGLVHEHVRPDRDENIVIYKERFLDDWGGFVTNVMNLAGRPVGDYDFRSVMHYSGKGGGFIPYENYWDNGYDNAAFIRRGNRTRCLLYKRSSSIALFCDVMADGGIAAEEDSENDIVAPRNVMLGESGWDHFQYLQVNGTDILLGTKRSTGELGTWMADPDGMPINGSSGDIIDNPILGYPVQGFADYGLPPRRIVWLHALDTLIFPPRQKVEIAILKDNGRFDRASGTDEVSSTSFTINGHWTDIFIPDSSDPFRWTLVNRDKRLVSRVSVDFSTGDFSSTQTWSVNEGVAKWDMIDVQFDDSDIIIIAHDVGGILEHFTLTPRPSRASSDRRPGSSSNPLPMNELDMRQRVTLNDSIDDTGAGHISMNIYSADDGERLMLMKSERHQSRAWFWHVEDGGFGSKMGEGMMRMERIQPAREVDIPRLGGVVLTEDDISAVGVLLRGNIEIRTGDPLKPFHRIGLAFINQRISDTAVIHIDGETILWAGDGRNGNASLHTLDARGKPSGRWRTATSIANWRTACIYQDPAGDDYFALMRARNTGRVRRYVVTRDGIASNEIQTINTNRWDQMRTLRVSDGRTFIGFVDRGRSLLEIRPVENGGGLGDPFVLNVGNNLDDVALLESEGNLFVFLTGENGVPELYLFVPGDRRIFIQQNIGDEDSRSDLMKSWNGLVSLGPDRVGLFDQPTGSMGAMSLKDITDFVTVRRYAIGDDWHTFESFENRNGGHMVINAQDGWNWR